jgi:hypothetical protein
MGRNGYYVEEYLANRVEWVLQRGHPTSWDRGLEWILLRGGLTSWGRGRNGYYREEA